MISDEQTERLELAQVFQWAALKLMIVRDGRLLMGRRLDKDDFGVFEFPGGKPEVGESLIDAIVREVKEEVGLDVKIATVVPILLGQNTKRSIVFIFAAVESHTGDLVDATEELDQIKFYSPEELKIMLGQNQIRPSFVDAVKMFLAGEVQVG